MLRLRAVQLCADVLRWPHHGMWHTRVWHARAAVARERQPVLRVPCCVLATPPRCRLRFACPQAHFFEAGTDVFSKTLGTPAFMGGCTAWGGTFAHGCLRPCLDLVWAWCMLSPTTPCLPSNDLLQRPRCGRGSNTMACRRTCGRWASPSTPSSSGTCPSRSAAEHLSAPCVLA